MILLEASSIWTVHIDANSSPGLIMLGVDVITANMIIWVTCFGYVDFVRILNVLFSYPVTSKKAISLDGIKWTNYNFVDLLEHEVNPSWIEHWNTSSVIHANAALAHFNVDHIIWNIQRYKSIGMRGNKSLLLLITSSIQWKHQCICCWSLFD